MEVLTAYSSVDYLASAIEQVAGTAIDDPYLARMAERAKAVRHRFDEGQTDTARALEELFEEIERNDRRMKPQTPRNVDALAYSARG